MTEHNDPNKGQSHTGGKQSGDGGTGLLSGLPVGRAWLSGVLTRTAIPRPGRADRLGRWTDPRSNRHPGGPWTGSRPPPCSWGPG